MQTALRNLLTIDKNYRTTLLHMAQKVRLTVSEWQLLENIEKGTDTQDQLAKATRLDVSTLSRQLSRLVNKRFLRTEIAETRKVAHRKTSRYILTDDGKAALTALQTNFEDYGKRVFDKWSDEDLKHLNDLLVKLNDGLEANLL